MTHLVLAIYRRAESIKTLDTTLITIHVCAFPSTDRSNCVDVSKCYLACLFRAQEIPEHISVRGRLNEYTHKTRRHLHITRNFGLPLTVHVPHINSFLTFNWTLLRVSNSHTMYRNTMGPLPVHQAVVAPYNRYRLFHRGNNAMFCLWK